tara:strand:+ start:326 stop:430 length:105 start_codon:yes stop_codon:yes gene_type:complete
MDNEEYNMPNKNIEKIQQIEKILILYMGFNGRKE